MNDILECIQKLDDNEFVSVLSNAKIHTTFAISTVSVGGTLWEERHLYINPIFWQLLSNLGKIELLKHEEMHILLNHNSRKAKMRASHKDIEPDNIRKLTNAAIDLEVNENIIKIPNLIIDMQGILSIQVKELAKYNITLTNSTYAIKSIVPDITLYPFCDLPPRLIAEEYLKEMTYNPKHWLGPSHLLEGEREDYLKLTSTSVTELSDYLVLILMEVERAYERRISENVPSNTGNSNVVHILS